MNKIQNKTETRAILLKTTGIKEPVEDLSYDNMRSIIGAELIEYVYLSMDKPAGFDLMVLDEMGKFRFIKVHNVFATDILHKNGGRLDDFVVGDVILTKSQYLEDDDEDDE